MRSSLPSPASEAAHHLDHPADPAPSDAISFPQPLPPLTPSPTRHQHCCLSVSSTLIAHLASHLVPSSRRSESPAAQRSPPYRQTTILSVGSGTGLLEALLLQYLSHPLAGSNPSDGPGVKADVKVYGVEVPGPDGPAALNRYLPPERRIVVSGSWDVLGRESLAAQCASELEEVEMDGMGRIAVDGGEGRVEEVDVVLMFVYPRQVGLVRRYLDAWLGGFPAEGPGRGKERSGMRLMGVVWAGPRADWEDYEGLFEGLQRGDWEVSPGWGGDVGVGEGEGVAIARRT